MSKERKENIKEMTEFYSVVQCAENYTENFEMSPLCDEVCEDFELYGFSACMDCIELPF